MSIGIAAYLMCFALVYTPAFSALPNASGPEQGLQDSSKSFSCTYQQDYNRLPLKTRSTGTKQRHTMVAISCSPAVHQIASLPLTAHPHTHSLPGTQRRGRAKQITSPQAHCGICCEVRAAFSSTRVVRHQDIQGPALLLAWAPGARNWSRTRRTQGGRRDMRRWQKAKIKANWFCMRACKCKSLLSDGRNITKGIQWSLCQCWGARRHCAARFNPVALSWDGEPKQCIRSMVVGWLEASLPAHPAAAFPSCVFHSFLGEQFCFLWWYCALSNSFVLDFSYSFVCVCLYTCVYLQ